MRKTRMIVSAGLATVALAGAAVAASRDTHILTVPLHDGSVAKIEYHGDVPPKVTIDPPAPFSAAFAGPMSGQFAALDRMVAEMQRRANEMRQRMDALATHPNATATYANYGDTPAGTRSYSMVTTSDGVKSCTRTVEITSQGAGKPPKVASSSSGDCLTKQGAPKTVAPTA